MSEPIDPHEAILLIVSKIDLVCRYLVQSNTILEVLAQRLDDAMPMEQEPLIKCPCCVISWPQSYLMANTRGAIPEHPHDGDSRFVLCAGGGRKAPGLIP